MPCSEKTPSDVSVITKAPKIKEEPLEALNTKTSTSVSQPTADTTCLSIKTEKCPEVKKSSEEIQQALKNDQQAKIPLKKRGMKFSEDFEKTSSVIVTNPLPAPLREIPKILPTPEQTSKVLNDHVNGEVKPASVKPLQRNSDSLADKERMVETVENRENMVTDESGGKDEKSQTNLTSGAEKITEATTVMEVRSPNVHVDNENVATEGKTETLPTLGVIKTVTSNHHSHDKAPESKSADVRESCIVANLPREPDKLLVTDESEKEKKSSADKKQTEETKMLEVREPVAKRVEETAETQRADETKPKSSGQKPKVETTVEEKSRDQSETLVDSDKSLSPPAARKEETVEEKDHGKKKDVTPTTETEKAKISKKSEESSKKSEETPAETSEKQQQQNDIKDSSAAAQIKTSDETQPEGGKTEIISNDAKIQDDRKLSASKSEAMEVDEASGKQDQTKPPVDDRAENAEERSEEKEEAPRHVDKKENQKTQASNKDEKMDCEELTKRAEVEQPSLEGKPNNGEGAKEQKDQEKLTNDSEKCPSEDKKDKGSDQPVLAEEKGTETPTKMDRHDKSKSSTEIETDDCPLRNKPDTEKPVAEEGGEKKEEKKEEAEEEEEVANGVKAPSDAPSQRGKRPAHRRKAEVQREEKTADSESDSNTGMSLRRSPRISRPTAKAVEISDKKQERAQAEEKQGEDQEGRKGDCEEEEVEAAAVEKVFQRKPREKKPDQEGQTKPKVGFSLLFFNLSLEPLPLFPPHPLFTVLFQTLAAGEEEAEGQVV